MGGGCGAREVISGRARPASGAWVEVGGGRGGHAHSLLGLLLLPLVYLAVHGVLVLVEQRRLITLVIGACARGRLKVERGARAELATMGVPWGASACHRLPAPLACALWQSCVFHA